MSLEEDVPTRTIALPADDADEIAFATRFWDETEILVKEAEQINHAMIVPAVSELRYGGRKLIDYVSLLGGDSKLRRTHLEDFVQCCIRARHDSIDAIVSYITLYLEELEATIDADLIGASFSGYDQLKRDLYEAAALVAKSRQERRNRNKIYSVIATEYVGRIVSGYRRLSEARSRLFAGQHARDERQHRASWIVAAAIALLAAAVAVAIAAFLI